MVSEAVLLIQVPPLNTPNRPTRSFQYRYRFRPRHPSPVSRRTYNHLVCVLAIVPLTKSPIRKGWLEGHCPHFHLVRTYSPLSPPQGSKFI